MRRVVTALAVAAFALASQPVSAGEANSTGTIRGRVVNGTTNEPQAGVKVRLVGALADGSDRIERTRITGADGRYSFARLATGADRFYTVDAFYQGGLFAGGAVPLPDNTASPPVVETKLRVWDTTTDPSVIVLERDALFAVVGEGKLGVVESVEVVNTSKLAYIGRGGNKRAANSRSPTLGFGLPPGVCEEQGVAIVPNGSDVDVPEISCTEFGFATTIAIRPGPTRISFSYRVEGTGGTFDLSRTALYPTLSLTVHATPPLRLDSNRLRPTEEVRIGDKRWERWSTSDTIEAADPIQLALTAEAGLAPLTLAGVVLPILLLVTALVYLLARRRRRAPLPSTELPTDGSDDVLLAIAELDLRYGSGQLSEHEWRGQRAELKARLGERARQPETTP